MFTSGQDEEEAVRHLHRGLQFHGLRLVEVDEMREVFRPEDIDELDEHLAANLRNFEEGHRTAWGTIRCYKGEGEA